ncbi:MAG TPA: DUF881 domain-containing protein [Mycobacteriales bacterium]|nr:DUF881 domain-containing protein [Mycobacteriales bacterium]
MTEQAPAPAPLWRRLVKPRLRRVDVAVALLLATLGFAAAVQVRATRGDGVLDSARQEDLVRILDDVENRSERLRAEIATLRDTERRLTGGNDRTGAALADAQRRSQLLGVLAGTVPARGPGVELTLTDPRAELGADGLLDALAELRDAGAEAIQIQGSAPTTPGATTGPAGPVVRVVVSTAFVDEKGGVAVDGTVLSAPYRFLVIGDPATLASALGIPGGVVDAVEQAGGEAYVVRREDLQVNALRRPASPRYARPARDAQ